MTGGFMRNFIAYLAVGAALLLFDSIWLGMMRSYLYQPEIGSILLPSGFRLVPAVLFYLLYTGAIVFFAVRPAMEAGHWRPALVNGVILGLVCYMTYDLTNYATLAVWSLKVTIYDMIWGMVVTGVSAFAGYFGAAIFSTRAP